MTKRGISLLKKWIRIGGAKWSFDPKFDQKHHRHPHSHISFEEKEEIEEREIDQVRVWSFKIDEVIEVESSGNRHKGEL
ncbi:hypothetical protein Sjap_007923 [Stephania japonica]|uniref:Uncharacterized protein n=1 Tax=Stephania japonica TaxID=461633 RepID=A0AAP0JP50_9MAGN